MTSSPRHYVIGDFDAFNDPVRRIFARCADSLGVALYLNNGDDRAFAVTDMVTEAKNPSVADRVHLRKLEAGDSIAVHSLMSGTPINGQSYMMPEHDCYHLVSPDQSSVLQIVYPHGLAVAPPLADHAVKAATKDLFERSSTLRNVFGGDLEKAFGAKDKYRPNTVLMFIDITGFTRMSHILGQKLSYDVVAEMQNECISPHLNKYRAVMFRPPEGDGLWIGFQGIDIDGLDGLLNERAMPLALDIAKSYDQMMASKDIGDYPLKISLTASEIDQSIQGDLFNAHIIHSGIGFFTVKELAEHLSQIQNQGGQNHMKTLIAMDSMTASVVDKGRYHYNPSDNIIQLKGP